VSRGSGVTSRPGSSGNNAPAGSAIKKIFWGAALLLLTLWPPLSAWAAGPPLQGTARFTPHVTKSMLDTEFRISRMSDPYKVHPITEWAIL
jgi:hypothetical protein